MSEYLQAVDDGLKMRQSGFWAAEKLFYLDRYINMFTTAMRRKRWRALHYIDLFAGPGKCVTEGGDVYLGSPLLALTSKYPFTHHYFVDAAADSLSALKHRCQASDRFEQVRLLQGDSNEVVQQIVGEVEARDKQARRQALNLVFLDPEGLELDWETVAAFGKIRADLVIHYPQGGISRAAKKAIASDAGHRIDSFFGGQGWREVYRQSKGKPGLHRQLIDFYRHKLEEIGYKEVRRGDEVGYDEPLMRNKKRAPLYRLLFASRHPLGHDFWKKVTSRDRYGQRGLFDS